MTTPQAPRRRNRQKARRTKQLLQWRERNQATKTETPAGPAPQKAAGAK
jgi:hypothetical protein